MDQANGGLMDQANEELLNGGIVVFLDPPVESGPSDGFEFGVDLYAWTVGPKFRGLKMIPPGLHFISYRYGGTGENLCIWDILLTVDLVCWVVGAQRTGTSRAPCVAILYFSARDSWSPSSGTETRKKPWWCTILPSSSISDLVGSK